MSQRSSGRVFYVICVEILMGVEIELLQLPKQGLIFYIIYCTVLSPAFW